MTQLCIDDAFEFNRLMRQQTCNHLYLDVPSIDWERDEIYHSRICVKCGYEEI